MDVDEVADELYGLAPEEFTAARDAAARAADDPAARAAVKALRKPTAAAHAVNRTVRERPELVDRLLEVGAQLRAAMGGDASEVRRLTDERRSVVGALVDRGLATAVQQDVTATFEAATADPDLGAAVRSGRLVKPIRYAGFGTLPDLGDVVATPAGRRPAKRTTRAARPPQRTVSPRRPTASPAAEPPPPASPPSARRRATQPAGADPAALDAARQRCLDLSGVADDAQRRYEQAVALVRAAQQALQTAEAERAEAHRAARAAHADAERARRDLGRLERG